MADATLWSATAADNDDADPSINMAEGMSPSAVNNGVREVMAGVAKILAGTSPFSIVRVTGSGTSPRITHASQTTRGFVLSDGGVVGMTTPSALSGMARLQLNEIGAGTLTYYSGEAIANDDRLRLAISDTSMQLHYNPIIRGVYDGASKPPSMTWKLPDHDSSNGGSDHPLLNILAVENSSTYPYCAQYTGGSASGTKISHLFLTLNTAGSTTPRLFIQGGTDYPSLGIGTQAPSGDFQGALVHIHANSAAYAHTHYTTGTSGANGSDGFYVGMNSSDQARIWHKENQSILFGANNVQLFELNPTNGAIFAGAVTMDGDLKISNATGQSVYFYYASASNHNYAKADASGNIIFGSGTSSPADKWEMLNSSGAFNIKTAAGGLQVNGTKVVGARDTGWSAMTGTPDEGTVYDTGTVTLAQLAGRVMALQTALTTHGLIGA